MPGVDETLETWCTIDDVHTFTGETVDEDTLVRAQVIIDLFSQTTFSSLPNISPRNLRMLNRATAYQAGWMGGRPDLFTHGDVDTVSQDGTSYTPQTVNAQLLAPFAARHLRQLTWLNKPWRIRRGYNQLDTVNGNTNRDSAVADDNRLWLPL